MFHKVARWGERERRRCFSAPPSVSVKGSNKFNYSNSRLSVPITHEYQLLKLHAQTEKIPFVGPHHFPKISGHKGKSNL